MGADVHKKLKVYAAKSELSVAAIIDQAVVNFMKEFTPDFLLSLDRKSKTSKK